MSSRDVGQLSADELWRGVATPDVVVLPEEVKHDWKMSGALSGPRWFQAPARVRYLPMPRQRIYRPLSAGRASRGRRVRSSRTSRGALAREPDEPHDVARLGGRFRLLGACR